MAAATVVDAGCDAGADGPRLIGAGHHWLALKVNPQDGEILQRRQLSFCKVDGAAGVGLQLGPG